MRIMAKAERSSTCKMDLKRPSPGHFTGVPESLGSESISHIVPSLLTGEFSPARPSSSGLGEFLLVPETEEANQGLLRAQQGVTKLGAIPLPRKLSAVGL